MSSGDLFGLLIGILILLFLFYVLLRPERF
jgi:K+-transporting ATPase KdpF subunit